MLINWHAALDLYFIAGSQDVPNGDLLPVLKEAIAAGITCFQYREKGPGALTDSAEVLALGQACRELCREAKIPFIVNDDLALALALKADGIHVGQQDQGLASVLETASQHQLAVGYSVNNQVQFETALNQPGLAYLGVGPIFVTTSKVDAQPTLGLNELAVIAHQQKRLPLVAIGGITRKNVAAVRVTGVAGIAVISALIQSPEMAEEARLLRRR